MASKQKLLKLKKLNYWLTYELSSVTIFILHHVIGLLSLYIFIGAALVFTPYMLKTLYELKKYGWIAVFFLFTCPPLLVDLFLVENHVWEMVMRGFSLASFYFYCCTLKYSIKDDLSNYQPIS